MKDDVIVVCPWCKTLCTIPEILFAKTPLVRTPAKVNRKSHLPDLASDIREKLLDLFKAPEDPNDWLDWRCSNKLEIHSFQVNIRTREVKK